MPWKFKGSLEIYIEVKTLRASYIVTFQTFLKHYKIHRGTSRTPATSKMEFFGTLVNS